MGGYNLRRNAQTFVDNPTNEAISFELDGKAYTLEAKSSNYIYLGGGSHTLIYSGETTTFEKQAFGLASVFSPTSQYSVLNPTQSWYIFYNEIYTSGEMSEEEIERALPLYECFDEEGEPDTCTEKYFDDVFIQENVDYGVEQVFPAEVKISNTLKYELRSKLFREEDFFDYIEGE